MAKRFYTCIIVPHASHRLHKLRIPVHALHVLSVIGGLLFFVCVALTFSYIGMAVRVADYDKLQAENGELRTQTKALKVSAEQLNTKITALETKSKELSHVIESDAFVGRIAKINTKTAGGSRENYSTSELLADDNLKKTLEVLRYRTATLESDLNVLDPVIKNHLAGLRVTPNEWPLRGSIASPFGNRQDPFTGEREMHMGIDISGLYRAPVKAPADGRVIYAARKSDYGNLIILDHGNGLTTRFGHLFGFNVRVGQVVHKGDVIGNVGMTGRTTAPHLHYEVRQNDQAINPRKYLASK
jgi:murein DD-endopeptidase MepM/ murein hydrolase activator NlpD